MGIMKIGEKYRKQMAETRDQLPCLRGRIGAEELYKLLDDWYKRNNIKFKMKPDIDKWPFNLTTAYRKKLKFASNWNNMALSIKAGTLAHERIHYMQRRRIKGFNAKYGFDPRFIIAVETPANREELRAYRAMGADDEFLERFVKELPFQLKKHYITVPALDFAEVKKHVRKVLNDELENPT